MHISRIRNAAFIFTGFLLIISLNNCTYLPEYYKGGLTSEILEHGDYIEIIDATKETDRYFFFIPGGLVDPHAYVCWADKLVEEIPGLCVVIVKFPSNLAILGRAKINEVVSEFEAAERLIIGGHSLGGVVAAREIIDDPEKFDGLILLGSYTTDYADLSSWQGSALSIYGSLDGLTNPEELHLNGKFLPEGLQVEGPAEIMPAEGQTFYYEIEGANHAGFGCYGEQSGDLEANIDPEEQQEEMRYIMRAFMNSIWP